MHADASPVVLNNKVAEPADPLGDRGPRAEHFYRTLPKGTDSRSPAQKRLVPGSRRISARRDHRDKARSARGCWRSTPERATAARCSARQVIFPTIRNRRSVSRRRAWQGAYRASPGALARAHGACVVALECAESHITHCFPRNTRPRSPFCGLVRASPDGAPNCCGRSLDEALDALFVEGEQLHETYQAYAPGEHGC
jgi:hypothetical protein